MALPLKLPWELAQTKWKSEIDPVLSNPILSGQQISAIKLAATTPLTISHSLGQTPRGWLLVDNQANSIVWRTQPFNSKTITLEASAATTISIWIY